jgi:hypothetical protein
LEPFSKLVEMSALSLDLQPNASAVVLDPATQTELVSQAIHERAKAHALHGAANL